MRWICMGRATPTPTGASERKPRVSPPGAVTLQGEAVALCCHGERLSAAAPGANPGMDVLSCFLNGGERTKEEMGKCKL